MNNKRTFDEVKAEHLETLKRYVPVVARVHGNNHPEFHKVHELFATINKKIDEAVSARPNLSEEFAELRAITHDYTVPGDVCESYEAVYKMLAELDRAFHA